MDIVNLDLSVDVERPLEGIREIVKVLRPEWDLQHIQLKDMSTGYVNRNYKVYTTGNNDSFFARIVPSSLQADLIDQYKLTSNFIQQHQLGPKLLCFFKNGLCTEFLQGSTMTWDTRQGMYDDNFWPRTAEILAFWHSKDLYEKANKFGIPNLAGMGAPAEILAMIDIVKNSNPESDFCKRIPSTAEYKEAQDWLNRIMLKRCPMKRFAHMDANATNWFQKDNGELILVDYDMTGIDYVAAEFGWFFLLHSDFRKLDLAEYPGEEHQMRYLRHYLRKRCEYDGETEAVTEEAVADLQAQVEIGRLAAYLKAVFCGVAVFCVTQKTGGGAVQPDTVLVPWEDFKQRRQQLERQGYH